MAIRTASDRDDAPEEAHEINVTPFIDVMLVLLIIFMVAAPLATVSVPVQLPASSASATPPEQAPVYVTVQADLSLRVGEHPVARDGLAAALKAATHDDSGQRIFLRADTDVPYGELMATLDALRAAGYLKVALVGLEQGAR
ncbi:TonB system transport protein ExbD [Stenotrophomonas forensis]|uniref:TonB system transport protein ExbD n=1 Tax=Stenotrophomonas forensis TaxID=2871169 RepID=UPI0039C5D8CF